MLLCSPKLFVRRSEGPLFILAGFTVFTTFAIGHTKVFCFLAWLLVLFVPVGRYFLNGKDKRPTKRVIGKVVLEFKSEVASVTKSSIAERKSADSRKGNKKRRIVGLACRKAECDKSIPHPLTPLPAFHIANQPFVDSVIEIDNIL